MLVDILHLDHGELDVFMAKLQVRLFVTQPALVPRALFGAQQSQLKLPVATCCR